MLPEFEHFVSDTRQFLTALDQDNSKSFWDSRKAEYDTKLKAPALALIDTLTPKIAELADCPVSGKLFRPHRDVRFSKDKTPYKTHLHMMWTLNAGAREDPVFFFGIGLDYVTVGAGRMAFEPRLLADWRKMLDLDTDRMLSIFAGLVAEGYAFREPALKRVPPPYPTDHPAAAFLRMKGCVASRELPGQVPLADQIIAAFAELWRLNALLISLADD